MSLTEAVLHLGRARMFASVNERAAVRALADCLEQIIKHLESEIGTPRPAAELQTFGGKPYKLPVEYTHTTLPPSPASEIAASVASLLNGKLVK